MNEVDKYLTHHGILGQKWGKQNGPPYPLNPANRSSIEKKKNGSNYTKSGLEAYRNSGLKNGLKDIKKQSAFSSNNASKGGGGGAAAKALKTTAPEGWIKDYRADMDAVLASNPDFAFGSMEEFTNYLSKNGVDVGSLSEDVLKGMYKTATDALTAYKALHKSDESKAKGKSSGSSGGKGSSKEEKEKEAQEEKTKEYDKIDSAEWKEKRTKLVDDFYSKFDEIKSKTEFPNNINEFVRMLYDFDLYKVEDEDGFPSLSEEQLNDLWKEVIRLIDERRAFEKEEKKDEVDKMAYRKELQHHGILGQKWGKQNGPPYPLNPANRSSAEKKQNGSKYTKSGLEAYRDAKLALGGGGGGGKDDEEDEEWLKKLKEDLARYPAFKVGNLNDFTVYLGEIGFNYDKLSKAELSAMFAKAQATVAATKAGNKLKGMLGDAKDKANEIGSKAKDTYNTAKNVADKAIGDAKNKVDEIGTKSKNITDKAASDAQTKAINKEAKSKIPDYRVGTSDYVYQVGKDKEDKKSITDELGKKAKETYDTAKSAADKTIGKVSSKVQDVIDMHSYPNGKTKLSKYEQKEFEKAKAYIFAKDDAAQKIAKATGVTPAYADELLTKYQKEKHPKDVSLAALSSDVNSVMSQITKEKDKPRQESANKARLEANKQQQKIEQDKRLKQKVQQAVYDSYTKTNPNNPSAEEAKKIFKSVKDEFVREWNGEDSKSNDTSSSNNSRSTSSSNSNDVISKLENSQFRKTVDAVKKTDTFKKFEDAKYVFSKKIERSDTYQGISDALEALGIKAPTSDLEKAVKRSKEYQNAEDLAYVLGKVGERSDNIQELFDNLRYYGLDMESIEKQYKENQIKHSSKYELYHHGILGMRWGKRNGPPYPLSRNPFKRAAIYGSKKINSGLEKISRVPQHILEKPAAKWKDRGDKYATRKKVAEEYLNGKRSDNPKPINNAENTYLQINNSNTGKTFTKPISSMTSNELRSAIEHIKLQNELVSLLNGSSNSSNSSNSNNYNSPPISTGREYLNDLNRDIGNYVKVGRDIVGLVGSIYDTRQKLRGKGDSKAEKALKDIDRITEDLKK